MKKLIVLIFAAVAAVAVFGFNFYKNNLTGVWPAVKPTKSDITKLLSEPAINNTDFPLTLPEGFTISVFAQNLGKARVLQFDPSGTLLLSINNEGRVVALPDTDNNGKADKVVDVVQGLDKPHGLAFRENKLYIAETDKVTLWDYDAQNLKATNKQVVVDLPSGGNHTTRTIMFTPDDELLISVGSTCNVCREKDSRRAKILVAKPDGSDLVEYASGLRNAVFMTLNPKTASIWVTEMGRDLLGDNVPPDEINIIRKDKNYGWPICYGNNIHDSNFDKNTYVRNPCTDLEPSHIDLQAHSAPLGLTFVTNNNWPKEYQGNLLVAYHGSWNRSVPTGYKIMRFILDKDGKEIKREDFISGWLQGSNALGRPVDLVFGPDSTLYLSDDKAGAIYKISYQK